MIRWILRASGAVQKWWWQLSVPMRLRLHGVEVSKSARFYGMPIVHMHNGSRIVIGDRAVLCSSSQYTALGVSHPVVLRTLTTGSFISIGADTGVSGGSICAAASIQIGERCLIGADVMIADTDFHPTKWEGRRFAPLSSAHCEPIVIEDDVFVGTGALVLKGSRIGKGSVIAARAIVTGSVPAGMTMIPRVKPLYRVIE